MRYLVTYDIVDDGRRARVARALMDLGERMQYSVFEMDLESRELEEMLGSLAGLVDPREDNIRVYRLCATCLGSVRNLGRPREFSTPERWVV